MEKGWENYHLGFKRDFQNQSTADSSKYFRGFLEENISESRSVGI